jgi:hypothetical protein
MWTTDNQALLSRLQAGVGALLQAAGAELAHSVETESQFSLEIYPDAGSLGHMLAQLIPCTDLFDVSLTYEIQNGTGTATLTPDGLLIGDWRVDRALSPPDLDPEDVAQFERLAERLSGRGESLPVDALTGNLDAIAQAGAFVDLFLRIFLDKKDLMQRIEWPRHVRVLLYVVAGKFLDEIRPADFPSLDGLLVPNAEEAVVVLLGDVSGVAVGPNILIRGRDRWTSPDDVDPEAETTARGTVRDAISFRNEECHWEVAISTLTPYHLCVESSNFDRADILEVIGQLRDRLCVAYLANRTRIDAKLLVGEFRGHKRVEVKIPAPGCRTASTSMFKLFDWAYKNSSSDKLGIVRQVISLQLEEAAADNYSALVERAGEILGISKSNFQLFLRRSVELYFDKRLKVSEFLRKFSEEMSSSISDLTSELVGNLYKTIGVILGVVIAALVDPDQTSCIALLASLLYLVYIGFILVYWLPSTFCRFRHRVKNYRHNVLELRDVLAPDEIKRLEGKSFDRARRTFWVYFVATGLLYAGLGAAALLVAVVSALWPWL